MADQHLLSAHGFRHKQFTLHHTVTAENGVVHDTRIHMYQGSYQTSITALVPSSLVCISQTYSSLPLRKRVVHGCMMYQPQRKPVNLIKCSMGNGDVRTQHCQCASTSCSRGEVSGSPGVYAQARALSTVRKFVLSHYHPAHSSCAWQEEAPIKHLVKP